MLRVHNLRFAGTYAEEFRVKLSNILQHRPRFHESWIVQCFRIGAGLNEFFRSKETDRLHALTQVGPEFLDGRRS